MDSNTQYILAIDQGTTSSRAILFDSHARVLASHAIELKQIYPANGWVEHDAEQIWRDVRECCKKVAEHLPRNAQLRIGITNQRETVLLWDRKTGKPLHNAIVWQDRRTAQICEQLKSAGYEDTIRSLTGLTLDPYFSGTKIAWLLDQVQDARKRAEGGELAVGTIDSWLIYNLTKGSVHHTDVTNASRTLLCNLNTLEWDSRLLDIFDIPASILPTIKDCDFHHGEVDGDILGFSARICGVAGDQQATMIGQACFSLGDVKATYGTGCFALVNTGEKAPVSENRLLATPAYRIGGKTKYAIEGSIFVAGAVVQWLRDSLGVIKTAKDVEDLAISAEEIEGLFFVPAFTGLGAPYWDPDIRGAIVGLTRDTGFAEIARAALEAVCFQTSDLLEAMAEDMRGVGLSPPKALKVDGGMVSNNWFCQRLADVTGLPVERPKMTETTALGAAYVAGLSGKGIFAGLSDLAGNWILDRRFEPATSEEWRKTRQSAWRETVRRLLTKAV